MVSVFLCGIGCSEKSSLFRKLLERKRFKGASKIHGISRKILSSLEKLEGDRRLFSIIEEQCGLEKSCVDGDGTIMSDGTVIDCIVYASLRFKKGHDEHLVDTPQFQQSLAVYKKSLVVLLSPFLKFEDGGAKKQFSDEEREKSQHLYISIFHRYHIPFLFISGSDIESSIKLIIGALEGSTPLETSSLLNFSKNLTPMSNKHINFSFFLRMSSKSDCIQVPVIKISEHKYTQEWKTWEKNECNRFIARHGADNIITLAFDISVKSTVVQKILLDGVTINGELYSFLGCSSSGLKQRKCFMWKGSQEDADAIIGENGKFDEKSVSKRMARISLLFSAVRLSSVSVRNEEIITEEDKFSGNGKCFTDGCGGISEELAKELHAELPKQFEGSNYFPSVYQIRYQGYKGVLALDPKLQGNAIKVRPSMKKFHTLVHDRIGVCGYSKPHTFGHLNRQYIMLLSGLGVPDEVFEEKQRLHFERVKTMSDKPENAIQVLQWQNKLEVAQRLLKHADEESMQDVQKCIRTIQSKLASESERLRILIPESRNIYGVCDPTGILEYGECFVRITDGNVGYPKTVKGQVVVCKNPCYLLGDVRVLKAVDETDKPGIKSLNHLIDCIVFPVRGKRPHTDEIAGSDLDGDMFFVTWDSDLIPPATKPPYDYPGAEVKPQGKITLEKTLKYFASQNETQKLTGKVDKYFRLWANAKGVESDECARMGMLFSRVIDSAKSGEKFNSRDIPIPPVESEQKFIWQVLEERASEFTEEFKRRVLKNESGFPNLCDIDEAFVDSFIKQEISNVSEFEKFQFAWNYIENHRKTSTDETAAIVLNKYADHINFALFSLEQKRESFKMGIPAGVITNALNKSKLLDKGEIEEFSMHAPPNTWKFYFRADHEEFEWSYLLKALTSHEQCLLVLRLPDQVTIALQFLTNCSMGEKQPVDSGTVTGYFYSRNFGYREKYILGGNYTQDLTKDVLQLYRQDKNQTFVCLKASDYSTKSNSQLGDETLFPISVDLLRFEKRIFNGPRRHPFVNKIPFVTIELFVENKSGSAPYFDTLEANYLDSVTETEDLEEDDDGDDQRDLSCLLSDKEPNDQRVCEAEETFKKGLRGTITAGQPIMFHRIVSMWIEKHDSLPSFVPDLVTALLERIVVIVAPMTEHLPESVTEALKNLVLALRFRDPSQLFKLTGFLSRVHLEDLAVSLIVRDIQDCGLTVPSLLDIFSDWQTWWFVDFEISKQSICNAARIISETLSTNGEPSPILKYVMHLGQLHFQDFLQDERTVQERIKSANSDFCISNLKIEVPPGEKIEIISFTRASALNYRPKITQGQFVAITRQADFRRTPNHESCCCLAQVKTIRTAPLTITVKLLGQVPMILAESSEKVRLWKIDLIANITTFIRVMDALKKLTATEHPIVPLFSLVTNPGYDPRRPSLCLSDPSCLTEKETPVPSELKLADHLNSEQNEAVCAALRQTITLIQGPPGTGKTTVACEIIKQAKKLKKSILVVAETNIAVDNIVKKLRNDLPFDILRIGTEGGVDREVYDLTLDGQLMKLEESVGKKTSYRDDQGILHRKKADVKKIFRNATIVLTTCAGAGDPVLDPYTFDFVLVDEATQTKETTLLCSLMHGAKQLVMIGDPKQLGPTVLHDQQVPPCLSTDLPDVTSLSKTLFHRLYDILPSTLLTTQHRMHPELMKFPSDEFYGGKLISGVSEQSRRPPLFPWPNKEKPLCFVDVEGTEKRLGTSFYNIQEIKVVQQVLDNLLDVAEDHKEHRLCITDIAILTLYQGQARHLASDIKPKVEVRSIDGFQGREKDVIVVSTVRSNEHGSLGFAESANRMNVLLTRAKRGLIVVGNYSTLSKSELWRKWLHASPKLDSKKLELDHNDIPQGSSNASRRQEVTSVRRGRGAATGRQRGTGSGRGRGSGRGSGTGSGRGRGRGRS